MIKKLFSLVFLLCFSTSFSQLKGIVVDSQTRAPLPYVNIWIENKKSGASADNNGNFDLPLADTSDNLIVSAVGYGTTTVKASDIKDTLYLAPKAITLDEVVVNSHKLGKNKLMLNSFAAIEQEEYFGKPGEGPFMLGRYIPYKESYEATPYLGQIRFRVRKQSKDMFFNLRLCAVKEDGSPGEFLYNENILVTFKKKKEYAIADLSKLNIRIPEEGFFVVAEFIITDKNISGALMDNIDEKGVRDPKVKPTFRYNFYGPEFIHQQMEQPGDGWMYKEGKWEQKSTQWKGKYGVLAAEITLID